MWIKEFILFLLLIVFSIHGIYGQEKYWEDLNNDEKTIILSDPYVCKLAVDYYNETFQVSDDSLSFAMLDTISDKGNFNQFYFYTFNKILFGSDGAVAEMMCHYCLRILLNYPVQLINYFSEVKKLPLDLYKKYVLMLSEELYYNEKNIKYNDTQRAESEYTYKLVKKKLDKLFKEPHAVYKTFMKDIKKKIVEIETRP